MIWVVELVVLLVFVGFGGFEGFIAWAVLTALILFGRHSHNQTKLKAAELLLRAERNQQSAEHVSPLVLEAAPQRASSDVDPLAKLDFRTMMWGAAHMVRRLSATQWEMKYDAEYCRKRIAELTALLARPIVAGPSYEACSECGTYGALDLHRASCSRFNQDDERAAQARADDELAREEATDELQRLQQASTWKPFPEKLMAAIETRYQRHLVHG